MKLNPACQKYPPNAHLSLVYKQKSELRTKATDVPKAGSQKSFCVSKFEADARIRDWWLEWAGFLSWDLQLNVKIRIFNILVFRHFHDKCLVAGKYNAEVDISWLF